MALSEPIAAESGPASPASTYAVTLFNVYNDLPSNSAQVVRQTRDGYIWIGTEAGLARFDGVRFVNFRTTNTPELPANLIRSLLEDREGWLWIATQDGVCRYRQGRFERIGLEGMVVSGLAEDRAGHIWLATLADGLWQYRDGNLVSRAGDPGMPPEKNVTLLQIGLDGRMWFILNQRAIFYYKDETIHRFECGAGHFQEVLRLVEMDAETLWVASLQGLFRLRGDEVRRFGAEQGVGSATITYTEIDRLGRLWVVANNLYLLEHPDAEHFVRVPVPGVENSRSLIEDREGSFWVGSAGDGIARLRPSGFRMISPSNGLLGGNVRTVTLDRQGALWAGLPVSGAARMANGGKTDVVDTGAASTGEVWSICPASDGRVWIGTRGVLRVWQDGQQQEFPEFQRVRALFEDRAGTLWIGSETAGVTRYRDGIFTSMVEAIEARQTSPVPPVAMAFAEDAAGALYIGLRNRGGLVKIEGDILSVDQRPETFDVRAIYPDREGNLWVGTKGRGLAVFHQGRWLNPDTLSERFNDQISAIFDDDQGRVWLGTPKGIVWTPKAQLLAIARGEPSAGSFRLALASDGVRPGVVGAGSYPNSVKGPNGMMWFGTRYGLVAVEPKNIPFNRVPPPVHIEHVSVDNEAVDPTRPIRLRAGNRALAIEYTALSFVGPSQVRFRYRLEGRDEVWVEAGSQRQTRYGDLRPGTYNFHVIACNDDGVWNETGANLAIIQLPFFYQTRWFYGTVALGLLGTGLGLFRWRMAALRQRNSALEHGIAERTAELAKSYEAIRASEYFYHSLVESLPQIIVRKDTTGRFTYANDGFAELIGRPVGEIVGKSEREIYPPEKAEKFHRDDLRALETRQTIEYESVAERAGRPTRYLHVKKVPLYDRQGNPLGVQILFWDMTTFREIEEKLRKAQRELVETSRLAGIAEMATGILHNLGNALNSVNITANLATKRIRDSRIASVDKVARLLDENSGRLPEFFSTDPRGRQLPAYLAHLADHLTTERSAILTELGDLQKNIDHIKELVASQQQHARGMGIVETMPPVELVEYAIRMSESALQRHGITIVREFAPVPPIKVERQKALQIVSNLLVNAKDAINETGRPDKRIAVAVRLSSAGRVQISVTDNGAGIAPENLTRIFAFGFTTKQEGHGFGLHSSALAAKESGGSLLAFSDGMGRGATFILELPPAS